MSERNETDLNLSNSVQSFFDKLPELLRPESAASVLGLSVKTIYDWRYRQKQKKIPEQMFLKLNRILYVRTEILKEWIASQNSSSI